MMPRLTNATAQSAQQPNAPRNALTRHTFGETRRSGCPGWHRIAPDEAG